MRLPSSRLGMNLQAAIDAPESTPTTSSRRSSPRHRSEVTRSNRFDSRTVADLQRRGRGHAAPAVVARPGHAVAREPDGLLRAGANARHAGLRGGQMSERAHTYSWDDPFAVLKQATELTGLEVMQKIVAGSSPASIAHTLGFGSSRSSTGTPS